MPAAAAVATCIALFAVTFDYTEHYLGVSDGTPAGTDTILRTRTSPHYFTQAGKSVVFGGKDRDHGSEVWVTDGTGPGTGLLKDINGKPRESSDPGRQLFFEYSFATSGSLAIFPAEDSSHGREIWVTDGTSAGTRLLKDFASGPEDGIDKNEIYGSDYIASNGGRTFL